jgi:GNAT superfamily N-acetyltransferase
MAKTKANEWEFQCKVIEWANEEIVIREATSEEIPQIISSSRTTNRFRMSEFTNEVDEEELRFWISDHRTIVIVAMLDTELIGYAYGFCLSPKWFFFDAFLIVPKARRSGIAKEMYAHLREACRVRGLELIQGLVKEGDPERLNYWINRGFEQGYKCVWVEDWLDED